MFVPKLYESSASLLVEQRANAFTRAANEQPSSSSITMDSLMSSQIELIKSRDNLLNVIDELKLRDVREFSGAGFSPIGFVMQLLGRKPDVKSGDQTVLENLSSAVTVLRERDSAVISIYVRSQDPQLAADIANAIAASHVRRRADLSLSDTAEASGWLEQEIAKLRTQVEQAETAVANYKVDNDLFQTGANNTSILDQQLSNIATQVTSAQERKNSAQSRANLIRGLLDSGQPIDGVADVRNSLVMQNLVQSKATLQGELAQRSSTLLANHPTIKALRAQIAAIESQIASEGRKVAAALEAEAEVEANLEQKLNDDLARMKLSISTATRDTVTLEGLQREAKAQRDLLETYLAKYREANTRETIDTAPTDGRIISRAIVSNTPAYPKKLPIVLIATIATLLLSSGVVVTGELLRQTAPRAAAVFTPAAVRREPAVARREPAAVRQELVVEPVVEPVTEEPAPLQPEIPVDAAVTEFAEIEHLADRLRAAGAAAKKVTVLGTAPGEAITTSTLTLARHLARDARVVVVDLAASSTIIAAVSVDASVPGLAELMQGEASFAQIITRDKLSRLHLVMAGRPGFDRSLLQSPRVALAIDALLRAYDHVLIDAGSASDLPAELLTAHARAVVVPDASMAADARTLMCEQLREVGFSEVTMLSKPVQPSDAMETPRVVAA
jgi:uncharacterized protein involved in exopolysaccharide biosynthesis